MAETLFQGPKDVFLAKVRGWSSRNKVKRKGRKKMKKSMSWRLKR